jgi:phosphatidylinositol-3-phosphatase
MQLKLKLAAALFAVISSLAMPASAASLSDIHTVFIVVMENTSWATIKGNTNCPYINQTLLPMASHCEQYFSPLNMHPTLPNYFWLVAGTNFGIYYNEPPIQDTTNHLAYYLDAAGISWKTYQMGLAGLSYPPTNNAFPYHTAFNPFVFFRNVVTNIDYCRAHMRPYEELAGDLTNQTVAAVNFIAPGLWYSMHDGGPRVGDTWLSSEIPRILASPAYQQGGAVFVTWDEDDFTLPQHPIGMIVVSPVAKGGGYQNATNYTHNSTLRTIQNIFRLRPYLGGAASATDLGDLFKLHKVGTDPDFPPSPFTFTFSGLTPNLPVYLQATTNLANATWLTISTNIPTTNQFTFADPFFTNFACRFYRVSPTP